MDKNSIEWAIWQDSFKYHRDHEHPPVTTDQETNAAWWTQATEDLKALVTKYNQHPLMDELLMTVYCYLSRENSEKLKKVMENDH